MSDWQLVVMMVCLVIIVGVPAYYDGRRRGNREGEQRILQRLREDGPNNNIDR